MENFESLINDININKSYKISYKDVKDYNINFNYITENLAIYADKKFKELGINNMQLSYNKYTDLDVKEYIYYSVFIKINKVSYDLYDIFSGIELNKSILKNELSEKNMHDLIELYKLINNNKFIGKMLLLFYGINSLEKNILIVKYNDFYSDFNNIIKKYINKVA